MDYSEATRCVHGSGESIALDGITPLTYPLFQTAAFFHRRIGHNANGFDYTRETNPTRSHLESVMASIEGAHRVIAFSSGMAAIATLLEHFRPGEEILCAEDLYGGVFRLHKLVSQKNGLTIRYCDTTDLDAVRAAFSPSTKALYLETLTNPTMRLSDIAACAAIAHDHGALLVVDNTFLTPYFVNPLDLGADVVVHSASKYLGGHNDTIGGFLCVNDEALGDEFFMLSKTLGNGLSPFDSWLIERGLKTLAVRMERQAANARAIAQWLEGQPCVTRVLYPGLESYGQKELFDRISRGPGAMISFYVDSPERVRQLLESVRVITFAESLGGVESLITYPIVQTHADTPDALKEKLGISDTLVRLSVGLEGVDDLIGDLAQALGVGGGESVPSAYDFDEIIDRSDSYSIKFNGATSRGLPEDVLPLWVADMDFRAAPPILEALHRAVDHGIFGYSEPDAAYDEAVVSWFETQHGWRPDRTWIVKTPGVVFGLAQAIRAFTEPGDAIIIQPPVYYPFSMEIRDNGRKVVENPLVYDGGAYTIDFEDFEKKIIDEDVRAFILCSPHNPVGRVWTAEELRRLAEICASHDVFVIADEIHCDLTWPDHPMTMFGRIVGGLPLRWMSATAPSKTFNLAGLQVSHLFVPDEIQRQTLKKTILSSGYSQLNALGLVAAKAAYDHGGPWLAACKDYLRDNLNYLRDYLRRELPLLKLIEPEGTYFAWIDCSALGLSDKELDDFIVHKAKLWLDGGSMFGKESGQFQRIVLACPRATLIEALDRLKSAIDGRF